VDVPRLFAQELVDGRKEDGRLHRHDSAAKR
jgi:hypothetical protein